jgi:S1-C subfamily serine protease/dienelactone hydrolase
MRTHAIRLSAPALAGLALALAPAAARADGELGELQEKAAKAAVARVAPSVVLIETSGGTDVVSAGPRGAVIRKGVGPTTGLVVSPDGYLVSSAFNFANKPSSIIVAVPGHKERYVAKAVATDQTRMLTLLKIEANNLPVPAAAPKAEIRVGQTAVAVGRTLAASVDQPPSVSVGIISAVGRIWGKALQTDAKVSPTNYGGPLVDLLGRVQGVLVPASPQAEGVTAGFEWYDSGIGFAIPLEDVNAALPRLKAGKDLQRGLLGISMQGQDQYGSPAAIASVAPGSAAEKAGIKAGDVITEVDGQPVVSQAQLMHRLGTRYEGDAVAVKVKRGKEEVKFDKVVLGGAVAAYPPSFLGVLPIRDDPGPGVEIRYVYPKSPAEAAGLKAGDRVTGVGREAAPGTPTPMQPVQGRGQLLTIFETAPPGVGVKIQVTRKEGKKSEAVTAKLAEAPEAVPEALPERSSAGKALGKPADALSPKGDEEKKDKAGEKKDEKKDDKKDEKKDEKKEEKKYETGLIKRTTAAADHSYWIYVPENYDPNVAHALVVWLHPVGKNKDRDVDDFVWAWQPYCEDQHIILLGPKTENERGWSGSDAEFIQEAVKAVEDAYTVDRRRVVAHGMGLGGEMAFYLGFHARTVFRGVAATGAGLTSAPKEKVAGQPLSFFLAVGAKDPLREAVKESKAKLAEYKYPAVLREVPEMGHQYLDGPAGLPTLRELVRWIDSLDRV